jgi:hypothetical protein
VLVVFQVVIVPQVILGMNVRTHFVMLSSVIMEVLVLSWGEQQCVLVLQGILEFTVMNLVVMVSSVIMEDGVKSMLAIINQNVFVFQVSLVPTVIRQFVTVITVQAMVHVQSLMAKPNVLVLDNGEEIVVVFLHVMPLIVSMGEVVK